jgi:rhodanese-related sulfurtransferase
MLRYRYSMLFIVCFIVISSTARAQHAGAGHGSSGTQEEFPFLSALMVKQEMAGENKPVLIDVGSVQEYKGGHIPGAINIPSVAIKAQPQRLPKDKSTRIIIYHGRGEGGRGRAHQAATRVWNMGYSRVSVFLGGMTEWIAMKYPVKKGLKP